MAVSNTSLVLQNTASQSALKSEVDSFSYTYKELDEEALERLSRRLGYDESPSMGKELRKFYLSLIQPDILTSDNAGVNNLNVDAIFMGLPVWLYPFLNNDFETILRAVESPDQNAAIQWLKIVPDWYYDMYKQKMDVQLVNRYVVWLMDNYRTNQNDANGDPNPVRAEWMRKRFPWIEVERKKTYYMIQKIRNKMVEISVSGVQSQGDLLFIYFSRLLFKNLFAQAFTNIIPWDFRRIFPPDSTYVGLVGDPGATDIDNLPLASPFKYITGAYDIVAGLVTGQEANGNQIAGRYQANQYPALPILPDVVRGAPNYS